MGLLGRLGRKLAERVAARVARDDLFEQPGERARTPPLSPPIPAAAPAAPRPAGGTCTLASIEQLREALGPGGGVRVVNHWATWCEPCVDELPHLVALREHLPAEVRMLGVSWELFDAGGHPAEVALAIATFAQSRGLSWPSLLVTAPPEVFFAALGLTCQVIPQTWVIADDGEIVERVEGVLDQARADSLAERVAERVAEGMPR